MNISRLTQMCKKLIQWDSTFRPFSRQWDDLPVHHTIEILCVPICIMPDIHLGLLGSSKLEYNTT